jgi:DNA adenine methylase
VSEIAEILAVTDKAGDSRNRTIETPQPVLRWAGGKRWLLPQIRNLVRGKRFVDYHEPFLGGAAVFFGLELHGRAWLSDLNGDLIQTYRAIRSNPEAIGQTLAQMQNTREHYYEVRASNPPDEIGRAARFIFLNHTSFNGLYRVNLKGEYNVPYGNRKKINLPTESHLRSVAARLSQATLEHKHFEEVIDWVGEGDLVFLDPPYTVAHNNNGFIKYNQQLFSFEDQRLLSRLIDQIRNAGAHYILTNAAHESIAELFEKGDKRFEFNRRNVIGGSNADRGSTTEYLFTNLDGGHG